MSRPSFAAGKLDDSLTEAFLALEEDMKDAATRPELFCLSKGGSNSITGLHEADCGAPLLADECCIRAALCSCKPGRVHVTCSMLQT